MGLDREIAPFKSVEWGKSGVCGLRQISTHIASLQDKSNEKELEKTQNQVLPVTL